MNYFISTQYNEYLKQPKYLGVKIGKPIPTVDLISIGIVSEDVKYIAGTDPVSTNEKVQSFEVKMPREYYAISKDFNIKAAWYSWKWKINIVNNAKFRQKGNSNTLAKYTQPHIEYWLRDNVLKPIFKELWIKDADVTTKYGEAVAGVFDKLRPQIVDRAIELGAFTLKNFTRLINKYGKTNEQIAEEIKEFIFNGYEKSDISMFNSDKNNLNLYNYYANHDWVVFSQLFGTKFPEGFPMYCRSLKQMLDEKLERIILPARGVYPNVDINFNNKLNEIKTYPNYPKQHNKYHALSNAKWNKELFNFLINLDFK